MNDNVRHNAIIINSRVPCPQCVYSYVHKMACLFLTQFSEPLTNIFVYPCICVFVELHKQREKGQDMTCTGCSLIAWRYLHEFLQNFPKMADWQAAPGPPPPAAL